jgi:hypothetical protein
MRGLEISRENGMPYVQFVESAGADLRGQGSGGDPEEAIRREGGHFAESGRLFYEITELSKMRIPTISVVFGASTAGGAYQPGMSDYNIFIRGQSQVALGGPALVKMATAKTPIMRRLRVPICTPAFLVLVTTWRLMRWMASACVVKSLHILIGERRDRELPNRRKNPSMTKKNCLGIVG